MENVNYGEIPIFFSCDDNYIPYLATTLLSLEENASRSFNYKIKVLHANSICEKNQKRILDKYSFGVFEIEFVDISVYVDGLSERFHTRDYYSKSTYYRLFIPKLYPNYDKALYLDCDIVVLGDISKLFGLPLGSNLVGAVPDESVQLIRDFQEYVVRRIGVRTPRHYFNAGVLVMNLKRLREVDFENMFISLISSVTFDVAQDQDYLNAICRGRVTYIGSEWNKMPFESKICERKINLIHYNLDLKPWKKDNVLLEKYFWQYADRSSFIDEIMAQKSSFDKVKSERATLQTKMLIQRTRDEAMDEVENARIEAKIQSICFKESNVFDGLLEKQIYLLPKLATEGT